MKILFFEKSYKLSDKQSEVLKVALLDSLRLSNDDITNFEQGSNEYDFLSNKILLLENLLKELGVAYV